jgi:hypothetical protein
MSPSNKLSRWLPAYAGFLLGLLLDPEDRGDMFNRNVGLFLNKNITQTTVVFMPQIERI